MLSKLSQFTNLCICCIYPNTLPTTAIVGCQVSHPDCNISIHLINHVSSRLVTFLTDGSRPSLCSWMHIQLTARGGYSGQLWTGGSWRCCRSRTRSPSPAAGWACFGDNGKPSAVSWCGRGCSSVPPDRSGRRTWDGRLWCSSSPDVRAEWTELNCSCSHTHPSPEIHRDRKHSCYVNSLVMICNKINNITTTKGYENM